MESKLDEYEFGARIHEVLSPSSPIQSHEFLFGREDQLDRIRRALMAPARQVFIYGERGVGKSSLANAAATECQSSDAMPLHASCTSTSSFASVVEQLIRQTKKEERGTVTTRLQGGVGPDALRLSAEREITTEPEGAPADIDAAASRLDLAFAAYSRNTVAVVDEFDRLPSAVERNKFGELLKALGDRKSKVKLIFTGVASSLDELLESHGSAHRQLDTLQLDRLKFQPRVYILEKAYRAFELVADDSVTYRIANVSNGFPYYVHLLAEHLLWAWYNDEGHPHRIEMRHLHRAFATATQAVHADLRKPYEKATAGLDHAAYALWATADAYDLERSTDAVWNSYCQICDTLEVESLDRPKLTALLRRLRNESHARILQDNSTKRRFHSFREAMVRGYVRMAAACYNIELDDQHFDPPPQQIKPARMSPRKRWMDSNTFIPRGVTMGPRKKG